VSAVDLTPEPVFAVSIEAPGATGSWDFVLADQAGALVLVPAGTFTGIRPGPASRRSRVSTSRTSRGAARHVALHGQRRSRCGPMSCTCSARGALVRPDDGHRYAKMQAVELDQDRGIARLAIVRNPYCDDRALVPSD
jgi:hypothetical protein